MGTLYLVATPIGNLDDITLRALHILESVPLIAAEDTRHTLKLLTHFGLRRQMISLHAKNEARQLQTIVARLEQHDIALVSDAGTPALSDPGVRLVSAAVAAGYPVVPVPGPAAVRGPVLRCDPPTNQEPRIRSLSRLTCAQGDTDRWPKWAMHVRGRRCWP